MSGRRTSKEGEERPLGQREQPGHRPGGEPQQGMFGALSSSAWLEQRVCECTTRGMSRGEAGEVGRAVAHIRARLAQQGSPSPPTAS